MITYKNVRQPKKKRKYRPFLNVVSIVFSLLCLLSLTSIYVLHSMMDASRQFKNENSETFSAHLHREKEEVLANIKHNTSIISDFKIAKSPISKAGKSSCTTNDEKEHNKKDRTKTLQRMLDIGSFNASTYMDLYSLHELPLWTQIESSYGPGPTIRGLETCADYRSRVSNAHERWVAPTGVFHSGTNLISNLLAETCLGIDPHFQVPWGKHNPIEARQSFRVDHELYQTADISKVMPLVMVRNPIDWMSSMCHQSYAASYDHSKSCPGLGQTDIAVKLYKQFVYPDFLRFWMDWNRPYLLEDRGATNNRFPKLVVRLEDLVYFPRDTLEQICNCTGGYFTWKDKGVPPNTLRNRQGGDRRKIKNDTLQIVESWRRHANVSLMSLPTEDQTVVSSLLTELQPLLGAVNYRL